MGVRLNLVGMTDDPSPGQVPVFDGTGWAPGSVGGGGGSRTVIPVSFASTITPALPAEGEDAIYEVATITGPMTVQAPSGTPSDGQFVQYRFGQDSTGHAITFVTGANKYVFGTDVTAALIPTAASSNFQMLFQWRAASSLWRALAIARGF